MTAFGRLLREYRQRATGTPSSRLRRIVGMSQNELARRSDINAAYVNRLEAGKQPAPSRDVTELLAAVLELEPADRDRLMVAAGHWPWALDDRTLRHARRAS